MSSRPAAGGGRWIDVGPQRFERWLVRFDERHSVTRTIVLAETAQIEAADGALAECHVPFPPLTPESQVSGSGLRAGPVLAHACSDRAVAVLLVRLGGYAAGVFEGTRLVASKVGSRPVHSRNKAGGQSQKRFHRRREEQAREAHRAAADVAARILLPWVDRLDAVVLGGDRKAVDTVGDDRRLAPLFALATDRFLTVPDPKHAVLESTPGQFRAVRIRLTEPT